MGENTGNVKTGSGVEAPVAGDFQDWFETEARCAAHPHRTAELTCARCGTFCCADCRSQAWCEACSLLVKREHLPATARSVAWKLILAPGFLLASAGFYVMRGQSLPAISFAWLVPLVCAVLVLRRFSARAAWMGAGVSLALLGWQAFSLFSEGAELRLIDVGLLAIAPLLALDGAARLGRLAASVQVQEQVAST
jgi:hypothetical protein